MYKKILLFALSATLLASSCSNDDETPSPYSTTIQGVNLTNVDAAPAGSIGNPDTKTYQEQYFQLIVYPNPSVNILSADVFINNPEPITLHAKLISVLYPGAPESTIIENAGQKGWVARTGSMEVPAMQPDSTGPGGIGGIFPGQRVPFLFETSSLPKGFYRLYIESSKGDLFWDNIWVIP